jgi:hypothetical protein
MNVGPSAASSWERFLLCNCNDAPPGVGCPVRPDEPDTRVPGLWRRALCVVVHGGHLWYQKGPVDDWHNRCVHCDMRMK